MTEINVGFRETVSSILHILRIHYFERQREYRNRYRSRYLENTYFMSKSTVKIRYDYNIFTLYNGELFTNLLKFCVRVISAPNCVCPFRLDCGVVVFFILSFLGSGCFRVYVLLITVFMTGLPREGDVAVCCWM